MNFSAFLAGSNLAYTFLDMVRALAVMLTSTPDVLVQTCPAVGISFCLIIVRLGSIAPEVRVDSWESFQRSGSSRIGSDSRNSRLPVALDRVKVERDVYVSASESGDIEFHMMSSVPPHEKQTPIH
jgi:hypothetical protein